MRPRYYRRDGTPYDGANACLDWARDFGGDNRVAFTEVRHAQISTIWLGLDHNFIGNGPPHIFETMVFHGPRDSEIQRYSTEREALDGHDRKVDRVRRAMGEGQQ